MSALVIPTDRVPMSAVAQAALAVCGPEAIWLDTGGTLHGIRVPDDATAETVRAQAELFAARDATHHENGLTTSVAPGEAGRPACAPKVPAEPVSKPPQRRRARQKTSPEEH